MIGTIAMNCVKEFFHIEKKADNIVREEEPIEGYVRNRKLFLKTSDQALKIAIFREKKILIAKINDQLEGMGYKERINEIYLK